MAKAAYEVFYDDITEVYNPPMTHRHFLEDDRYTNIIECVHENTDRQLVLDAGCGNGWLASLFLKGNDVVGIDISDINLKKIKGLGILPVKYNLDFALPFKDNVFDTIVCTEVLEHIFDPEQLLREFLRILKPSGRAILTVPNLHCIRNRRDLLLGKFSPFIEFGIYPDKTDQISYVGVQHIHHYTLRGMGAMLETIGFDRPYRKGQSFHLNFSLPFQLLSLLHGGNRGLRWFLRLVTGGRSQEEFPGLVLRLKLIRILGKLFPALSCGMLFVVWKPSR